MKHTLSLFVVAAALLFPTATVQAQNDTVTVDSTINISPPASGTPSLYQVEIRDDINVIVTPNDPATNDPDGNNIVDVVVQGNGSGSVAFSIWLTGRPLGEYTIKARALDSNGNAGPWAQKVVDYVPPGAPGISVSALLRDAFQYLSAMCA